MATTKQAHMIAGRMVEFQDRFEKLPNDDAQWVIQNAGEAIDFFIYAAANRSKATTQAEGILSDPVAIVGVPATIKKFIARDRFVVDTGRKAKVKISCLGNNFRAWFIGKSEEPFAGSTLNGRDIKKGSVDALIIAELGEEEKVETTLTELYTLMEAQPNGQSGSLLNNNCANIFYVRDIKGILRRVGVLWNGCGWRVNARSVSGPNDWSSNLRVFSRYHLPLVS